MRWSSGGEKRHWSMARMLLWRCAGFIIDGITTETPGVADDAVQDKFREQAFVARIEFVA